MSEQQPTGDVADLVARCKAMTSEYVRIYGSGNSTYALLRDAGAELSRLQAESERLREELRRRRNDDPAIRTMQSKLEIRDKHIDTLKHERAVALAEVERLKSYLDREGYRRCDIPACNCGSFHGGHAYRRLIEIAEVVAEHHQNGFILLDDIKNILAEVERLKRFEKEHLNR